MRKTNYQGTFVQIFVLGNGNGFGNVNGVGNSYGVDDGGCSDSVVGVGYGVDDGGNGVGFGDGT